MARKSRTRRTRKHRRLEAARIKSSTIIVKPGGYSKIISNNAGVNHTNPSGRTGRIKSKNIKSRKQKKKGKPAQQGTGGSGDE